MIRPKVYGGVKLTFPQKCSRLADRMRDPEWRKYAATVATGKFLGVGLTMLAIMVIPFVIAFASALFSGDSAQADATTAPATAMAPRTAPAPAAAAAKRTGHRPRPPPR